MQRADEDDALGEILKEGEPFFLRLLPGVNWRIRLANVFPPGEELVLLQGDWRNSRNSLKLALGLLGPLALVGERLGHADKGAEEKRGCGVELMGVPVKGAMKWLELEPGVASPVGELTLIFRFLWWRDFEELEEGGD